MHIAIITSGYMPVPAVMGGAVEALDDYLIRMNEQFQQAQFTVYSVYHPDALKAATHEKTEYIFIHTPVWIRCADRIVYWTAKHIFRKKKHMSYRYILQRLWFIRRTGQSLAAHDYDQLLFENHPTLLMTLKYKGNAQKYAGRYSYHMHNTIDSDFGCRDILLGTRKVLAVSEYMRRSAEDRFTFKDGQTAVWRNSIDLVRFQDVRLKRERPVIRRQYGIDDEEIVLLFSGRMTKEKGIRELLLAFLHIVVPGVKLVVAGGYFFGSDMVSDFEKELFGLAEQNKDSIVFTGYIPYERMPAIYAMADIACLPSLWDDPAPLTVIESMASGLPLITTDSGGIPEYANEQCAFIFPRNDQLIAHLTEAIQLLATDGELRKSMAQKSLETAQQYTLERYYTDFLAFMTD